MDLSNLSITELNKILKKANLPLNRFDPEQLIKGARVELEHGTMYPESNITNDDPIKTIKIAWAHLLENDKYYDKLEEMEKTFEKQAKYNKKYKIAGNGLLKLLDEVFEVILPEIEQEQNITTNNNEEIVDKTDKNYTPGGYAGGKANLKSKCPECGCINCECDSNKEYNKFKCSKCGCINCDCDSDILKDTQLIETGLDLLNNNVLENLEFIEDEDLAKDYITDAFKDLGGMSNFKIIIKSHNPQAICELKNIIDNLKEEANVINLKTLKEIFSCLKNIKNNYKVAINQYKAFTKLASLKHYLNDNKLQELKNIILSGDRQKADIGMYKTKCIYASKLPNNNTRLAYISTDLQPNLPYLMCPKAKQQIGKAIPMEISKCRDNCIDSRITHNGKVICAYSEWLKTIDNHKSVFSRKETHPEYDEENLLNVTDRNKNIDYEYEGYENRFEKYYPNRNNFGEEKSIEYKLNKLKDSVGGHTEDKIKRIQDIEFENETENDEIDNFDNRLNKSRHNIITDNNIESQLIKKHKSTYNKNINVDKLLNQWLEEDRNKIKNYKINYNK